MTPTTVGRRSAGKVGGDNRGEYDVGVEAAPRPRARRGGVELVRAAPDVLEDVLDPQLPIVDAHHHLWGPDSPLSPSRYLLDELASDLGSGHLIEQTVFVEAGARYRTAGPASFRVVGETEFAADAATSARERGLPTEVAAGIVARADLALGAAVDDVLDAHLAASGGRLRGIRDPVAPPLSTLDRDERRLLQPLFREGLARVAARGLPFDVFALHFQLGDVIATVREMPDVTFVLDHLGSPVGIGPFARRREEVWPRWRADVATIAREPNVVVKLGGMGMYPVGFEWHKRGRLPSSRELATATGRYFHHSIDVFGPQRCMFESNFPPDKLSGSYRTLWNSLKLIAAPYTIAEKTSMFSGNARRIYRL
jgi:L-fuconolactonase